MRSMAHAPARSCAARLREEAREEQADQATSHHARFDLWLRAPHHDARVNQVDSADILDEAQVFVHVLGDGVEADGRKDDEEEDAANDADTIGDTMGGAAGHGLRQDRQIIRTGARRKHEERQAKRQDCL